MEYINKIKNTIPIFTLLFISLGYIKLYSRYEFLGIDIVNYLDLSEILLLFIKEIIIGFFVILIAVFFYKIFENKIFNYLKNQTNIIENSGFLKRFWVHIKPALIPIILLLLSYFFHKYYDNNTSLYDGEKAYRLHIGLSYFTFSLMLLIPLYFMLNVIEFYFKKIPLMLKFKIKYLILMYSVFALLIYYGNQSLAMRDMARGDKKVIITIEETEIVTNKNMPFMGETKNFIFIYDKYNCTTLVFDKANIKNLSYGFHKDKIE